MRGSVLRKNFFKRLMSWGNSAENPSNPLIATVLSEGPSVTAAGRSVTIEKALELPAVWGAVNLLSRIMASLPLQVYATQNDKRVEAVDRPVTRLLKYAPNKNMTSFQWRKYIYEQLFTYGRCFSHITRDNQGRVKAITPLDPYKVSVERHDNGALFYSLGGGKGYPARDIIDLVYSCHHDGLNHYSPILNNREVIGLALEGLKAATNFYGRGGLPNFAIETDGDDDSKSISTASTDLTHAAVEAMRKGNMAIVLPQGTKVVAMPTDQRNALIIQIQQYVVEQVARIYNIPPVLLNDMSKGTFANTEQSGHHLAKYTVRPLCAQIEQELTMKLFGTSGNMFHVEHDLTDLLKGDSLAFTQSMSTAIASGQVTPNEARAAAGRDPIEGGEELWMQSGNQPVSKILAEPEAEAPAEPAADDDIIQPPIAEENDDDTEVIEEDQA